ncbi:MAG TPA: hypothetical protein VFM14_14910 [Gemmatimonadales bacterium]|nr:hypothetical protein [Gemmatimonadales bacterium]
MTAPARLTHLQALIAQRFPDAVPVERWSRGTVPTGVEALDRILPNGGFQRGRLAVWTPGMGAAALLRAAARRAVAEGERVAWIDATRTVAGACWREGPLLVRPESEAAALRAGEELGRSGGYAFVVLDGVEPRSPELVRCARAAHDGGTALVLITRATSLASLRLSSQPFPPVPARSRPSLSAPDMIRSLRVKVTARASGWHASAELTLPVGHDDLRLSLGHRHPDRRGVRR